MPAQALRDFGMEKIVVVEAEKFDELLANTSTLNRMMAEFKAKVLPAQFWFTREECARLRSRPRSYFDQNPQLLPNWGIPEDWISANHGHSWKFETVMAWVVTPLHEIERKWDLLEPREQARIRRTRMTITGRVA